MRLDPTRGGYIRLSHDTTYRVSVEIVDSPGRPTYWVARAVHPQTQREIKTRGYRSPGNAMGSLLMQLAEVVHRTEE